HQRTTKKAYCRLDNQAHLARQINLYPPSPYHAAAGRRCRKDLLPQKSNLEFLSRSRPAPEYPLLVLEVQIPQVLD
ncbi:unnamed protein product, partial [Urochloa humidicola]